MVLTSEQIQAYIRIVIYWIAGFAVNYGLLAKTQEAAWIGAGVTLANLGWTMYGSTVLAKLNEIAKFDLVKTVVVTTRAVAEETPSAKITLDK